MLINLCSTKLKESKAFYTTLFDFKVDFDSDWFVHLISESKQLELGIIDTNHEIVPDVVQTPPNGFYITLVVDNADTIYEQAKVQGIEILKAPHDTFYGQRRLLIKDPNGVVLDVSSLL